jgi:hypothetical protein
MNKDNSFYSNHLLGVVWVILLLSLSQCKQDREQPNPCAERKPTSAAFVIEESFGRRIPWKWDYYATDTVCQLIIRLSPIDSSASFYEWQIGAGKYQKRNIEIEFPNSVLGTSIPITLIMKKTPDLACFPQDDGVDTVRKFVHFLPITESLVKGDFVGHYEDKPNEEFTITIDPRRYNPLKETEQLHIYNLLQGCGRFFEYNGYESFGFRQLVFFDNVNLNCRFFGGGINVDKNREDIKIWFYYIDANDPTASTKTRQFIGKRKPE